METTQAIPQTLQEAMIYFSNKENAFNFIKALRWPDGNITCPRCGNTTYTFLSTRLIFKCKSCKKQFSVKVGTVMEDSALGIDKWVCAMWLIANAKNGISSYEVGRSLGITQKSAWHLMHRVRLAMHNGTIEKLSGTVEADETYIGGKARNMHKGKRQAKGRGAVGKAIVMGLLERGGRVVTEVIPDTKKKTLHAKVKENVEKDSNLCTDTFKSYVGLEEEYIHEAVNHDAGEYVRDIVHTNGLENYWSLLKRCVKGTYIAIEPFHLFRYCDEQAFRFNARKGNDAQRFVMVVSQIAGKRLTYKHLIGEDKVEE